MREGGPTSLGSGTRLGPDEILGLIGAGGMGEVYKALDTRLDRTVALKVLPAEFAGDADRRARFAREAKAVAALSHPHICALYDVGRAVVPNPEFPAAEQRDRRAPSPEPRTPVEVSVDYLVMEYLEGETLSARLARAATRTRASGPPASPGSRPSGTPTPDAVRRSAPLPLDETLRIGTELAEALAAAHRAGIIHRDLKPGNVMLTPSGAKVLDFGLARLRAADAAPDASAAATHSMDPLTDAGTRLGTVPYMAPEQVEGKEADARSDIFALGAVLYELATGRRAFEGDTTASIAAAILDREPPPLTTLHPLAPPAFEHVVTTCLAKDPEARWQAASDIARELRWVADEQRTGRTPARGHPAEIVATVATARRRRRVWIAVGGGAAALLLFGLGAATVWLSGQRSQPPLLQIRRFVITTSPADELGGRLDPRGRRTIARSALALSPDGSVLAFTAAHTGQPPQLYVRRPGDETARALADTQGAEWPFFSPDGAWLGFWADNQLKKTRLDGGPSVPVCRADALFGASWAPDGTIVFAGEVGPLMAISPSSHEPRPLTRIPPGSKEVHRLPHVLPDGSGVLFTALDGNPFSLAEWETARVEVMTFASAERQVVVRAAEDGRYVPTGHVLYARGDAIRAVPFDLASRRATGSPAGILKGVMRGVNTFDTYWETGAAQMAVSDSGTLVYVPGGIQPDSPWRFGWLDRTGRLEATPIPPGPYLSPSLSPDGTRVAFRGGGTKPGVWIWDFARSNLIRVTSEASNRWPLWYPDGRQILYSRLDDTGRRMIVRQDAGGGTGTAREVLCPGYGPAAWSPDGKTLVFTETGADGEDADILLADLDGQQARVAAWRQAAIWDGHPALSPNGKWLAYTSGESGDWEVYVESFPKPGSRHKVSTAGGEEPTWAPGGAEVFFMGPCASGTEPASRCFFAVPFRDGSPPMIGRPRSFAKVSNPVLCDPNRCYDIAPDGRRFLVTLLEPPDASKPSSTTREMQVVLNWFEELKAKVPVK